MNKKYTLIPAEYFWILHKKEKLALLSELKRRVEILNDS